MHKTILSALVAFACLSVSVRADSAAGYLACRNADFADNGIGPGFMYSWDLDMGVRIDSRLSYIQFYEPDLDMVPLEVAIAYQLEEFMYQPYAGFGAGWYFLNANRGDADGDIGFQLFTGMEADVGWDFDVFAEISWLFLESDVDGVFAATEKTASKIDLDGFGLSVGLMYRF